MSRIGRMPIAIPAGVTVEIAENNKVTVKGPKGTLERVLPAEMDIKQEGSEIVVSRPNDLKKPKLYMEQCFCEWVPIKFVTCPILGVVLGPVLYTARSEEHTSELQSRE